jgi:hypothetical protein
MRTIKIILNPVFQLIKLKRNSRLIIDLINKILYIEKKTYIFALPLQGKYHFSKSESLYIKKDVSLTKNNIPPMPLFDAHLGGFSFLNHITNG